MPEMVALRALDSCRRPEGSCALGRRMGSRLEPHHAAGKPRDAVPVAQWLQHPTRSQGVVGSIPSGTRTFFPVLLIFNISL